MPTDSPPSATRATAEQPSATRTYLRLLGYLRPYRGAFALGILATLFLAACDPAIAVLLKPLLDGSFIDKDPAMIRLVPLAMIGIFLVRGVSDFTSTVALAWVGNRIVTDLRNAMFAKLLSVPGEFHDTRTSGSLVSKFTFDATQLTQSATKVLMTLVRDSLSLLGLLGLMLYLNWELTLIAMVCVPFVALIVHFFSHRMRRLNRTLLGLMGQMTHVLDEAIGGHRIVKIYGAQAEENRRFAKLSRRVHHFNLKVKTASALHSPLIHLVTVAALALIIWIASRQSAAANFSVGEFASFMGAMGMLLAPMRRLAALNEQLQRSVTAAESVFALIDERDEPDEGTHEPATVRGELHLEGVRFAYNNSDRPALDAIDLHIAPGQTVAFVGPSGSGKSTLLKLLPRLYQPSSGRILLDGIDIATYGLTALRNSFAYVGQETVLFNDSVAANICYGEKEPVSRQRLETVAAQAQALDFINALPQGFDTVIGEDGLTLSGGQRQRLAIARAVLKNAPILLLDEATSALDSESEQLVQSALEIARRGHTTLVVAHRLSTVVNADLIVMIADGRILASGTHAELMRDNPLYQQLFVTHQAGHDSADA